MSVHSPLSVHSFCAFDITASPLTSIVLVRHYRTELTCCQGICSTCPPYLIMRSIDQTFAIKAYIHDSYFFMHSYYIPQLLPQADTCTQCVPIFNVAIDTPEFASICTNNGLKSRLDVKDAENALRFTISLSTSTWSHCFVGIEVNSRSV